MSDHDEIELHKLADDVRRGGAEKYHEAARTKGKLFCRDRLGLLLDEASFVEDALFANVHAKELPADGVVTGVGTIDGRPVCVMANDSTVKAGSWGARTVEKILRIQETAMRLRVPLIYLVDSAGARITDQIEMFPGRRGAGRIFYNQVQLSGQVPQLCLLFGPSAAGGAYIPAFCDVVVMVEGNASMYLGSDRMVAQVTGVGEIDGRKVAVMANDSTVKAGSWGARTVEKILRIQETAVRLRIPLVYLVDSAGARITDQIQMFPGRRGAGRIFSNQVHMSGMVPQICLLFGPSAAGGAYIPAFCDVVVMVEGNASMYLGSPRMAQEVIGERVTLEEMGGARMHCTVSGCGDVLVQSEQDALAWARRYVGYLPLNHDEEPRRAEMIDPAPHRSIAEMIPANQNKPFDMREVVLALIDEGSWCEIKELFAAELLTGLARIGGRVVGILANQPKVRGGVLFVDSADKAARFIWLCDAFNIALIFLADVPGFMIGSKVERDGIIRHGAKMISAVTEATVPKFSVIVRKAYGAGLYAMAGPAFDPEVTIALPTAMIAVMGPEAAVNAVYANKIAELPEDERATFIEAKREEFRQDIDVYRLAGELVIDAIVDPDELRSELIARLDATGTRVRSRAPKRRPITPV